MPGGRRAASLDQGGWPIRFLIVAAALAFAGASIAAVTGQKLEALIWTAKGHEAEALTLQPASCFRPDRASVGALGGYALFNAPQLLGGQAERAGMSCASCHANGRVSRHFFLAGISSAPGTADVSSSFFALARANGRFDPVQIPDLAMPGKVSHDPASGALERFIRGLIVEEFAGKEPSAAALHDLADYVRAQSGCTPDGALQPRGMADQIELVRAALAGAVAMTNRGEGVTAQLLIRGARHQLGLIAERLPQDPRERRLLLRLSAELKGFTEGPPPGAQRLSAWADAFERIAAPRLLKAEPRSLYAPARFSAWLEKTRQ